MIRPFTCVCLVLAAGAGLYTYQAKHQAELVDREIARVLRLADAARQRTGVLRAEYALLNDPSRLAELAGTHLPALHSTAPGQFTTLAELDRRLPPVGLPPGPPPPVAEPPAVDLSPIAAATPPAAAQVAAADPPKIAPAKPVATQRAAVPATVPMSRIDVAERTTDSLNDASFAAARASVPTAAPALPIAARVSLAAAPKPRVKTPKPVSVARAPVADPFVTPVSAPAAEAITRIAQQQAPPVQAPAGSSHAGSALGMARSLIAPAATYYPPPR